ncbi:nitrate/nitrite transporter [Acinetobacter gerneri]|uniref:Nitrate/nitrite transporter n=1 Tax=Acinetobacter gerneri TaxID=202952 RepID=A0AAW8JK89_9GAMM|nr:nitrate/nitrite transporter [Acinetobacter gerneri]MDQ9009584.1 nitrate/nitrite transporter [Acinetobacter gerneri]MDQ9013820.1 nitrate/nitrite transporter [Acinetobacter gerneri]MDQ9024988.1 nitrate/nitrite transporter [Acinetobacter gerneri]MDQ9052252.1 nitrate/nitrite transporter [Acinetobacter gerneri]MDQ9059669.1 nitrate/nitrite transporter [Acinetobacter gerneri]
MKSKRYKANSILISNTLAFTVCFMIWMVFAVLGIPIKEKLNLNQTEFGILAAMPVLSGSLIRVPLGIWTDRYGGRIVFFILMLICIPAVYLLQFAHSYWQFLILGLWMGLIGGSFSIGTPYVAKWFDREHQGLVMGIFGAGNAGTAVNKFIAPAVIVAFGWTMVPTLYAVILTIIAIVFWFTTYTEPSHQVEASVKFSEQLRLMKDPAVLRYSQYYSIVFGGYVGLSLWMVSYYVQEYHFDLKHAALLAACFSLPGGVLRALGGWLSDKYGAYKVTWAVMWVCWVVFFILSYPQTKMTISTVNGPLDLNIGINATIFTVLLFTVGIAMAIGKASVFKFIANDFPKDMGTVSGVVGLAGGLGGFLLPILFGLLVDFTGIRSSSFMLMYGCVSVSLIWMHFSFKPLQEQKI